MIKKLEDRAVDQDDLMSMQSVKNKLYDLLCAVYNDIDAEIAKEIKYNKLRFISGKQAKERIIEKYHPQILNDERETELVVNFKAICADSQIPESGPAFVDYLATELTPFMSVAYEEHEIEIDNSYVQRVIKPLMAYEIVRRLQNKQIHTRRQYDLKTIQLSDLFRDGGQYNQVINILIHKKMIDPDTHIWIDTKKGGKTMLVEILKGLHGKGYYKNNYKPSGKEIQAICKNTFGYDISEELIKRNNKSNLDFIPPCPDSIT